MGHAGRCRTRPPGFVLGHRAPFAPSFDFAGRRAEVARDGSQGITGRGLRAGDIVPSGSLIAPLAARPGDCIQVEFEGLGSVAVSFAETA